MTGNVYVADSDNYAIRMITPAGVVTTFAGAAVVRISSSRFPRRYGPVGVAVDPTTGNVLVAYGFGGRVNVITPAGVVTTLAATPGALPPYPEGVALDSTTGNVYVADDLNNTIFMIPPAGLARTLAGTAPQGGSADGTGAAARFDSPNGVAVDSATGNVYVADTGNDTIRMITPAGVVTTFAGTAGQPGSSDGSGAAARFNGPVGVAVDPEGNVYVADTGNDTIRMITPAGVVTTVAGTAGQPGSSDGTGPAARFDGPSGVAVDPEGNVYVADSGNETIRRLSIPSVPAQGGLTGTSPLAVTAALTGLTPGTTYSYRVVSTNTDGTTFGDILSVTQAVNTTTTTLTSSSPNNTSVLGQPVTFTATVAMVNPGSGTPTGTITFKDGSTTLGTSMLSGGLATLTVPSASPLIAALSVGTHSIIADYSGDLGDLPSSSNLLTQVITSADGPHVKNVERFGFHAQPTTLVIQFNEALDPARAQNVANYRIVGPDGVRIAIIKAMYDSAANTVTLSPKTRLDLHKIYSLTIIGTGSQGVCDRSGNLLDGTNSGVAGGNFVTRLTAANLVLTEVPGGPLRLKQLRRVVAKIAALESAYLKQASAKPPHVAQGDKARLHDRVVHRKP
jgi:DNA-binding beta-propeller fold protein YncE